MKITLYVNEEHLENLSKFLFDGKTREIYWHSHRLNNHEVEVTVTYSQFLQLNELI
jgi:hypothetical protein